MKYAIISTEKGDMKAELYEKETPVTVENFVNLAGKRFYDGLTFHRFIDTISRIYNAEASVNGPERSIASFPISSFRAAALGVTVRVDRDIPFPAKHPPDDNTTTGVCSLWPIGARIRAARSSLSA